MLVQYLLLFIYLSCGKRKAYKTIEEKLIKSRTLEAGEIFKRAEEPIEELKNRKPASDKTHGSLLCAELSAVH